MSIKIICFIIVNLIFQLGYAGSIVVIDKIPPKPSLLSDKQISQYYCFSYGDGNNKTVQVDSNQNPHQTVQYVIKYEQLNLCSKSSRSFVYRGVNHRRSLGKPWEKYLFNEKHRYYDSEYGVNISYDHGLQVIDYIKKNNSTGNIIPINAAYAISPFSDDNCRPKPECRYTSADSMLIEYGDNNVKAALKKAKDINANVVNYSISDGIYERTGYCDGFFFRLRQEETIIKDMYKQGIIVVASMGNTAGAGNQPDAYKHAFPACLSTTIGAGSYKYAPNRPNLPDYSPLGYFSGSVIEFVEKITYTSYSAAIISAKIERITAENPFNYNAGQIKKILWDTADSIPLGYLTHDDIERTGSGKVINVNRAREAMNSHSYYGRVISLLDNKKDPDDYGYRFGDSKHKNGAIINFFNRLFKRDLVAQDNYDSLKSNKSYYRFSLKGYDIDNADEVAIYLNDKFYGYLSTTGNNVLGAPKYYYLDSNDLKNGSNNIKLRVKSPGDTWGITDLLIEKVSADFPDTQKPSGAIRLNNNQQNNNTYGYVAVGAQYNKLVTNYSYNGLNGVDLSLSAYDIDSENEVGIYINGQFFKNLIMTGNEQFKFESYYIPHYMLKEGDNTIEFRQYTVGEWWAVRGLLIKNAEPKTILPMLYLLLLDD